MKIKTILTIFIAAFVLQTLHEIEHIAQVYQRLWLGVGPEQAHGILFFLDVEWNHFLFNLAYFTLLSVLLFIVLSAPDLKASIQSQKLGKLGWRIFTLGFLIQGYHVLEHTVRMGQFFQLGCTPCPGILGNFFDIAYLHFIFNTTTWLLPIAILPALLKLCRLRK